MSGERVPLLIHSLAEFRHLILQCLEVADARRVVEVGGEDGTFTRVLLSWALGRDLEVVCIDPWPRDSLEDLARESRQLELVRQQSVAALPSLAPADAYLLDGDHNYFTVLQELRLISAAASPGSAPIVFLHDVGWPSGRRDQYYDPDAIPPEARHDYTWDGGVVVGEPGVVAGGFRGAGEFAVALEEGGPGNGVLTAVEDFLQDRPELSFHVIPAIFGLGVIFERDASYGERLEELLRPYSSDRLLQRLEDNRLALYLAVLDLQDRLAFMEQELEEHRQWPNYADLKRVCAEQALLLRDAQVENRALWGRLEKLEEAYSSALTQKSTVPEPATMSPGRQLWQALAGRQKPA